MRAYAPRSLRWRLPQLWHRLFWLPFWRAENMVGLQQSALTAAALGSALPWMLAPQGIVRGVLGLATCTLLVLVTDRGDKAVREQCTLLQPALAGWPFDARALFRLARGFALAPAALVLLAVLAGGARHDLWVHTAGRVWLVLACAALVIDLEHVRPTPPTPDLAAFGREHCKPSAERRPSADRRPPADAGAPGSDHASRCGRCATTSRRASCPHR